MKRVLHLSYEDDGKGGGVYFYLKDFTNIQKKAGIDCHWITIKNNNKAKKQGLGLGLFISKNLLAKSQGEIKFSQREGGGGLVKIVLSKNYLNLPNE